MRAETTVPLTGPSKPQLHAGTHPKNGSKMFHTDSTGLWWCGWSISGYTPQELLKMARSLEADLLRLYPDLE